MASIFLEQFDQSSVFLGRGQNSNGSAAGDHNESAILQVFGIKAWRKRGRPRRDLSEETLVRNDHRLFLDEVIILPREFFLEKLSKTSVVVQQDREPSFFFVFVFHLLFDVLNAGFQSSKFMPKIISFV